MMMLGRLQRQWIDDLLTYPQRQITGRLGTRTDGKIKVDALGQLLLTDGRFALWDNNESLTCMGSQFELNHHYEKFGLRSPKGHFAAPIMIDDVNYESLLDLIDSGISWADLAIFIGDNAEAIFKESM